VACAACYSRLKTANHHIAGDAALRARVAEVVGSDYDGRTPVRHVLEILCREIGRARIAAAVMRPLTGLKVACYYGCLLTRPPEITNFDDAENPTLMDQLMETAGATALDWPHKTECCGASFSITDPGIVLDLSNKILAMAQAAGADCIATACPLCQLNLDMRQKDIERKFGLQYNLPVFYFTQLLGLALGCSAGELSLGSLVVEPRGLLASKGIA
jgi:heterodisulfide reductase subunit B